MAKARRRPTLEIDGRRLTLAKLRAFEAQRPAVAARGLAEAENDLAAFLRGGNRVVVSFPHRGEALRTKQLMAAGVQLFCPDHDDQIALLKLP